MSAFDALTKIKQAVEHPKTDHLLPKSRSLAFKAITGKAALKGTKGDHCELVHGDHWKELKGNETMNVKLDQKLTVKQHQTIKVVGNHKETLVGKVYQNVIGPHIVQNNAVRNETRLSRYTLVYGQNELASAKIGDAQVTGFSASACLVIDMEYASVKWEVTLAHEEMKLYHEMLSTIDISKVGTSVQVAGTSVTSNGVEAKYDAEHLTVSLEHTAVTSTVKLNVTSACTYAGLVLGPNQVW